MNIRSLRCRLMVASALTFTLAAPAFAQDSVATQAIADAGAAQDAGQPVAADAVDQGTVGDIVVTAQRRSQSLLSVPLSIQASSGEQLESAGIYNFTQLQLTTPGYVVTQSGGQTQIYMRGIGNAIFVGANPSVATYYDDVPRVYGSLSSQLANVSRVEILKGAQGGLYGLNATGGVVNVITRQPDSDAVSGSASVTYGDMNTLRLSGYINVPISSRVALNVAVERATHDPYIENISFDAPRYTAAMFPGGSNRGNAQQTADLLNAGFSPVRGLNDEDVWIVDSKLRIELSDDLRVTFGADWSRKNDSYGAGNFQATPAYQQQNQLLPFLRGLLGANPVLPPDFLRTVGDFQVSKSQPERAHVEEYGASARIEWDGPGFNLLAVTAYRDQESDYLTDLCHCSVPVLNTNPTYQKSFWYQELRLVSSGRGRLNWLVGGTYLSDEYAIQNRVQILPNVLPNNLAAAAQGTTENWSLYAQVGYAFTDELDLTVSGRLVTNTITNTFVVPAGATTSTREQEFLPSATLRYQLTGGGNIYARWARGFKAGGIAPFAPPALFTDPSVGSFFSGETVDTYEVGLRAPLLGGRMQVTAAAFYNSYSNLQVGARANAQRPSIISPVVNAGSARTYGVEGSITWRVIDPLTISVFGGYLNARYGDFSLSGSPDLVSFDLSGRPMVNAPEIQASFQANLDQPVSADFRLVGNALVSHVSSAFRSQSFDPARLPDVVSPAYWLTNARLGLRTTDDKYEVAVFVNNLFNQAYTTYGVSTSSGNVFGWGDPRVVGAEVRFNF